MRRPRATRRISTALGVCAPENGTIFQLATLPQEQRSTVEEGSKYPRNRAESVLPRTLLIRRRRGEQFDHGGARLSRVSVVKDDGQQRVVDLDA